MRITRIICTAHVLLIPQSIPYLPVINSMLNGDPFALEASQFDPDSFEVVTQNRVAYFIEATYKAK